jgi:hypothetical protein
MKIVLAVISILSLFVSLAIAKGETCSTRAQNCVLKWGGPTAACYDAFRLAACAKTGKYVAPNGNVWPAKRADGQAAVHQGHIAKGPSIDTWAATPLTTAH